MSDDAHDKTPQQTPTGRGMDRRRLLNWTWRGLAAGLVVDAGWTAYDVLIPRAEGGFGGAVPAGAEGGFPEGQVRYFATGRFYLTRVEDELLALYQKCPHLGCRVPFCDSSGRFECPCHGSIFNRKGEYLDGPAPRGMDRFPVATEEGQVLVDTGTVIDGPAPGVLTMTGEPAGVSCLGEGGGHGEPMTDMPGHDDVEAHDGDPMGDTHDAGNGGG